MGIVPVQFFLPTRCHNVCSQSHGKYVSLSLTGYEAIAELCCKYETNIHCHEFNDTLVLFMHVTNDGLHMLFRCSAVIPALLIAYTCLFYLNCDV